MAYSIVYPLLFFLRFLSIPFIMTALSTAHSVRNIGLITAFMGFTAVALGAFGTHVLRYKLPLELYEFWTTACHYHLAHALALLGCYAALRANQALEAALDCACYRPLVWAARLWIVGIVLFAGLCSYHV